MVNGVIPLINGHSWLINGGDPKYFMVTWWFGAVGDLGSWNPPYEKECYLGIARLNPKAPGPKPPIYHGVFPKIGVKPPKWMVKIMENPIQM